MNNYLRYSLGVLPLLLLFILLLVMTVIGIKVPLLILFISGVFAGIAGGFILEYYK